MRFAVLLGLVSLFAPHLHAQARQRPFRVQAQNLGGGIDLSDPSITASARSDANPSAPVHGNSVPVSQLRIPSKARKEFERSEKAFHAGDLRASTDHLERAVQIYPDFLQAHNVLGVRYAGLGKYDESLAEYQRVLAIDPSLGATYHNISVVLFFLGRYQDAEEAARRALELRPQEAATRYVLGCILVKRDKITAEALQLLRESEGKFPNASLALAQVSFKQGRIDEVIAELRAYLRAPKADNKSKVECWLAQLTHEPTATCTATSPPAEIH
jgi:tetratricopeptide (TPR) repeat protein